MKLRHAVLAELDIAMDIINMAKAHLKEQGIDQWQQGYPDLASIKDDMHSERGYFVTQNDEILGYLCIDFGGEPAYDTLDGTWASQRDYVVVHRMAFHESTRGRGLASRVFQLVEELSAQKGIHYFRLDTDEGNRKMQHLLKKNGFTYRGPIIFDNTEKIAFDKEF